MATRSHEIMISLNVVTFTLSTGQATVTQYEAPACYHTCTTGSSGGQLGSTQTPGEQRLSMPIIDVG